jgi:hypothetical protein
MTCDKCGKPATEMETVVIQTSRQTFSSPADYEEQAWCVPCCERSVYLAENESYERARTNGWAD